MIRRMMFIFALVFAINGCSVAESEPDNEEQDISLGVVFPLASYSYMQTFSNPNSSFSMKYHCAEDAYGSGGTPVFAVMDGRISFSDAASGYGWLITIDHEYENVYSLYGHLSTRRFKMSAGDSVSCGDIIGYLADDDEDGSGDLTDAFEYPYWAPHLHFGMRNGKISDYPDTGDSRWSAGYTEVLPATIGWLNPSAYLVSKMSEYSN